MDRRSFLKALGMGGAAAMAGTYVVDDPTRLLLPTKPAIVVAQPEAVRPVASVLAGGFELDAGPMNWLLEPPSHGGWGKPPYRRRAGFHAQLTPEAAEQLYVAFTKTGAVRVYFEPVEPDGE